MIANLKKVKMQANYKLEIEITNYEDHLALCEIFRKGEYECVCGTEEQRLAGEIMRILDPIR